MEYEVPVSIFISYAHEDETLLNRLKTHLKLLERIGFIIIWNDRCIEAGREWNHEIDQHLNSDHIILLLISSDFMDSDYCYSIEMKQALERQKKGEARVIPIILRPVLWKGAPFDKLQALPTGATPITSWPNQDEAFLNVAEGISDVAYELRLITPETYRKTLKWFSERKGYGFVKSSTGKDIFFHYSRRPPHNMLYAVGESKLAHVERPNGLQIPCFVVKSAKVRYA